MLVFKVSYQPRPFLCIKRPPVLVLVDGSTFRIYTEVGNSRDSPRIAILRIKSFKTPSLFIHNIIGYGSEPSGYGDDDVLPDLTPFLILGIAILGLSLLFPTAVHIENVGPGTGTGTGTGGLFMGRKRRYADEGKVQVF